MFCVIQEVATRRPDKSGYSKELCSEFIKMSVCGQDCSHYYYSYSTEKFERPLKPSYRISIHSSYRKAGKVRKHQYVLCTVRHYELVTGWFSLYDWADHKIQMIAEKLGVSADDIYNLVNAKIEPLQKQLTEEFQQTEEYKTHAHHEEIIKTYNEKKRKFAEKYDVSDGEYDKIYDIYGVLQNSDYLEKIKADYQTRKEYESRSWEQSRSYYENFYGNYNSGQESSYQGVSFSNYTDEDRDMLKRFYRVLSKKYHPDANPDIDTSKEMRLLNQLKETWGV